MASEHPTVEVSLRGVEVVVRAPDDVAMTPEAAEQLAQLLLDAADSARAARGDDRSGRARPPFPPADLVSPHGAG